VSDIRTTDSSRTRPRRASANTGRAVTLTAAIAVGVLLGPLVLAGLLCLAVITMGAAMSGGQRV